MKVKAFRGRALRAAASLASVSLLCMSPARVAQADVWDNSDNNNLWSDANNWSDNTEPTLSDPVSLPTPIVGSGTITMVSAETAASLNINDSYTLSGNSGSTLQLGSVSGSIAVAGNKTATLSIALINNANPLSITGGGKLVLNNGTSRTGTTTMVGPTVRLNSAAGLGSGTIHVGSNAFLEITGGLNVVAPISFDGNSGMRAFSGQGIYGGVCTVATSTTVFLNGGALSTDTLRFGNVATNVYTGGAGSNTVVTGPGTVWLFVANDYAGSWEIDSGTLRASFGNGLGGGTTPVVINSGGTLFLDSFTANRDIRLFSGTLALGNAPSLGKHTVMAGSAVTIDLRGGQPSALGDAPNDLTGGSAFTSSIAVTSDTPGGTLVLSQPNDYLGTWSIGSNATVQINQDATLGGSTNPVTLNGGTLQTVTSDITTSRSFTVTNSSTIDVAGSTTYTLSNGIGGGSGALTKAGFGTLTLQAAATRTGTVDVAAGEMILQHAAALGSSAATVHATGTLTVANVIIPNGVTLFNNSTLRGSSAAAGVSGNIVIDSGASTTNIESANGAALLSLSGAITGGTSGGTINFNGTGIVVLGGAGANSATGLWQINSGLVGLNKSVANGGISASNVSIGDGSGTDSLVLDVGEQIWNSANVNVFTSGIFNLNGNNETIGTVTMSGGGTITGNGGTLILNGSVASGITVFTPSVSANITTNVNLGASTQRVFNIGNGTATNDAVIDGIISGSGGFLKNNAGSLHLTGSSSNTYTGLTSLTAGRLTVAKNAPGIIALPGDVSIGDGSGSDILLIIQSEQMADTGNLTINGSGAQVDLAAFTETINNLTMTAGQVTATTGTLGLNGTLTTNASATTATIAPTVSLTGGARTFNIADGAAASDLTISGPVVSGTMNKSGAGKLTLSAATVTPQNLTINLNAGSLDITQNQHLAALNVASSTTATITAAGTTVLYTKDLAISGTGRLDMTNNKLIVTNTPIGSWNGSAYTDITGLIASGRNGNTVPLWDGSGIVTSQTVATSGNLTSIAVARASDVRPATATATTLWAGQTITGTDTLVMYTYGGDATLDGKINIDDYVKIDSGIAGGYTGWSNGDFNYDGKVSIDDYITVIDANIGNQNGVFPTSTGGPASAGLPSAVPEPAASAILLAVSLPFLRRKRQRKRQRHVLHAGG